MPLIARQRSRLAVLAVLALVGSLLAVSAVPVAAEDGKADAKAMYSACVGAATEDAGFTDTDGNFDEAAANCLAHYRITEGTSAGVFSPKASVSRLQMALFLARAAGPAGVELPAASDQGFTDIGGMISEIQNAINQVAEKGFMEGRSRAEFAPTEWVTRADMALYLVAFLDDAIVGPGGKDIEDVKPDDKTFTDIDDVPNRTYTAIRKLYEMEVATGTTSTTFSPNAPVNRGQMAAFITRTLAHTNARPEGLTVQADKTDVFDGESVVLTASLRDSKHMPVDNESVDFFRLKKGKDDPFDGDGECRPTRADRIEGGALCEIDRSDPDTNPEGNVDDDVSFSAEGDTTIWAWTGKNGDEYDDDNTNSVTIEISANPAAHRIEMTTNLRNNAGYAKFGDEVTFTFQVVDSDGDPVAKKDASVTLEAYFDSDDKDTSTYKTDSSGMFTRAYTKKDPTSNDDDDPITLALIVIASDLDVVGGDGDTPSIEDDPRTEADDDAVDGIMVKWDDDKAKAKNLKLSADPMYRLVPTSGKAHSQIEALVTDQYGNQIKGVEVWFAEATIGSGTDDNRYTDEDTNSRGKTDFDISSDEVGSTTVRVVAILGVADYNTDGSDRAAGTGKDERPADDDPDIGATGDGTATTGDGVMAITFYWAMESKASIVTAVNVVTSDTADSVVVVDSDSPKVVEYDSDDNFDVEDEAAARAGTGDRVDGRTDIGGFESALSLIGKTGAAVCADSTHGVTATLAVEYNEDEDGDGINLYTLTLGCEVPS